MRNRVLVLVALIALTPVALAVVELPTRSASINFLGSALSITLSTDSLLLVLMPVLTCAGVDWVLRSHPDVQAAYATVAAACKQHGKTLGMGGVYDETWTRAYIALGARFLLSGNDNAFLMAGASARSKFLRGLQ